MIKRAMFVASFGAALATANIALSDNTPQNVYDAGLIGESGLLVTIQVEILDPSRLQSYVEGHAPSLAQYGGRLIYLGAEQQNVEGDLPHADLIAIHAWPDQATFLAWYNSEEYRPWREYRQNGVTNPTITMSQGLPLGE